MKFKGIVIGLLAAILVVNTVMAGILITEAKKQTQIVMAHLNMSIYKDRYELGYEKNIGLQNEAQFWIDAVNEAKSLHDKIEFGH